MSAPHHQVSLLAQLCLVHPTDAQIIKITLIFYRAILFAGTFVSPFFGRFAVLLFSCKPSRPVELEKTQLRLEPAS